MSNQAKQNKTLSYLKYIDLKKEHLIQALGKARSKQGRVGGERLNFTSCCQNLPPLKSKPNTICSYGKLMHLKYQLQDSDYLKR